MRRIVALVLILGSCTGRSAAPTPPDIVYGRDVCVQCGMIISDPRFAAAYSVEGDAKIFDDIGDMLVHGLGGGEIDPDTPAWVHDFHSSDWIDARVAWFVHAPSLLTPMDHGLAAFYNRDDAVTFAGLLGRVLTWDNLLAVDVRDTGLDFDARH